jgi:hypothetical protein
MQIKATLVLSTLAVFAAAHDGHDASEAHPTSTDYCWSESTSGTFSTYTVKPTVKPSITYTGKPSGGYNATYTGKPPGYTSAVTTKPASPTTPGTQPPATTAGASKSEFAMAVLGLGLAAGLIL